MHNLNELFFFTCVVEQGGFSAAERVLDVPRVTLAKGIERLEGRLGVRLLEVTTRSVKPTQMGERLYSRCRGTISDVHAIERDFVQALSQPSGTIEVNCQTGIAKVLLAREIPGFLLKNPLVRVRISAAGRLPGHAPSRADIVLGSPQQANTRPEIIRKFGMYHLVFAASPGFIRSHTVPDDPANIGALPTLTFEEDHGQQSTWLFFGPNETKRNVTFSPVIRTNEVDILLEAASLGAGIALLPAGTFEGHLREARLTRVLPQWRTEDIPVTLSYGAESAQSSAGQSLIRYLQGDTSSLQPNSTKEHA